MAARGNTRDRASLLAAPLHASACTAPLVRRGVQLLLRPPNPLQDRGRAPCRGAQEPPCGPGPGGTPTHGGEQCRGWAGAPWLRAPMDTVQRELLGHSLGLCNRFLRVGGFSVRPFVPVPCCARPWPPPPLGSRHAGLLPPTVACVPSPCVCPAFPASLTAPCPSRVSSLPPSLLSPVSVHPHSLPRPVLPLCCRRLLTWSASCSRPARLPSAWSASGGWGCRAGW